MGLIHLAKFNWYPPKVQVQLKRKLARTNDCKNTCHRQWNDLLSDIKELVILYVTELLEPANHALNKKS